MKHYAAFLFLLTACLGNNAFADYCEATRIIEESFDPDKFTSVELKALAGDLEVSASRDNQINFRGRVCTDTDHHLDMMDLDVLVEDNQLKLIVVIPYHQDDFDPYYAIMDIEFSLPEDMVLHLRDSSGDMRVSDVSVASIQDSSGDIRVYDTRTSLFIRDSSGEIMVRGNRGDVKVSDSSGDIDLRSIDGTVEIPGDSSGGIEVNGVTGSVIVDRDSSGDIEIDNVDQDVTIGSDGSGDISIHDVRGTVRINSDGSGEVSVGRVEGDFSIEHKGTGDIRTRDIGGRVNTPG